MEKTYTKTEMFTYLLGLMGENILYYIVMSAFSYNLQSILYFPAMAVSTILLLGQILDGFNDPFFGKIIDSTNTKWGKCRPYLIFSTPIITIFTIMLFVNGTYSSENTILKNAMIVIWAGVAFIIWGILYSLCDVPIWSMPNLMTEKETDRSKLMANAKTVSTLGVGISLLIIPISQMLSRKINENINNSELSLKYGLFITIFVLAIIGGILLQLTGLFTKEHIKNNNEKIKFKDSLFLLWKCRPFRLIMISRLICSISATMDIVSVTLYSYYYGNNGTNNYIIFLLAFNLSTFFGLYLANIIIPKFINKFEKSTINNLGCLLCGLFCVLYFCVYLFAPTKLDAIPYVIIICAINIFIGFGNGSRQLVQSIMIADCVDYEEYSNGFRPDAIFTSGQLIVTKISTGVGSLINGIVFSVVGFSASNVKNINNLLFDGLIFKSDPSFSKYRFAMFFLFTIPPAIGFILSIIPMKQYPLNNKLYSKIHDELIRRRNMKNNTIFYDIQDYLSKEFSIPKDSINLDSNLIQNLGLNSLALIQIIADLENKYEIIVDDDSISDFIVVNDIVTYIIEKRGV